MAQQLQNMSVGPGQAPENSYTSPQLQVKLETLQTINRILEAQKADLDRRFVRFRAIFRKVISEAKTLN